MSAASDIRGLRRTPNSPGRASWPGSLAPGEMREAADNSRLYNKSRLAPCLCTATLCSWRIVRRGSNAFFRHTVGRCFSLRLTRTNAPQFLRSSPFTRGSLRSPPKRKSAASQSVAMSSCQITFIFLCKATKSSSSPIGSECSNAASHKPSPPIGRIGRKASSIISCATNESYAEKWEYVRQNPVRAKLVSAPEDWPFCGEIVLIDRA